MKEIIKLLKKPEMSILPGQIAFFLTLSIVPIIALLGVLATFFSISLDIITDFIKGNFPTDVSDYVILLIAQKGNRINFILFSLLTLLIASNGIHSIVVAANSLYGKVANKGFFARRIKALSLTVVLLVLFIFIFAVPAFGDKIFSIYQNSDYFLGSIAVQVALFYLILKWPISFFLIYFTIKLIYTIAPDKNVGSKNVTIGAIITSFLWIVITMLYSYYINNIASYDILYGSLSNIVILMLWIYLLSASLVFGMLINYNLFQKIEEYKLEQTAKIKVIKKDS